MRRSIVEGILSGFTAVMATSAARGIMRKGSGIQTTAASFTDAIPTRSSGGASLIGQLAAGIATATATRAIDRRLARARHIHPAVSTAYVLVGLGWTVYKVLQHRKAMETAREATPEIAPEIAPGTTLKTTSDPHDAELHSNIKPSRSRIH